jgi:hypothetical protein
LATMIADPKESESKAKTIAAQLPNRLPMRGTALGATSGSCTQARCSISSPNHEIAITETRAASRPKADGLPPRGKGHLDNPPTIRRIAGNWWYGYTPRTQCTARMIAQHVAEESARVQVFSRRRLRSNEALRWPAAEKRQGTKSRWVGHGRCSGLYGDLTAA